MQILSINVCGLKSKLLCPEFVSFIEQYDIIGIQESKLDDVDNVQIQGFQVFSNNRTSVSRYRSGGITLLIKNEISPFITVHKFESKLILWLTISKNIILSNEDLHCGIVYIPPYRSKYAHDDPYLEIQKEVDKYMSKSRNILLFGDFNSRTGLKCDFVRCDKFISESNGNEDLYNENVYMLNYFDKYDILLQRNSADLSINFYGQQLLEFCKSNNIFILNGRLGASKSLPKIHVKTGALLTTSFLQSTISHSYNPLKCLTLKAYYLMHIALSVYQSAHNIYVWDLDLLMNSIPNPSYGTRKKSNHL